MAVIIRQINDGAQDAHEGDDGANFSSTGITLKVEASTTAANRYNGGMYHPNIPLVAADTVGVAYEYVVFTDATRDSPDLTWYGNDVDDAADFVTDADVTTRKTSAQTTASVAWSTTNLGTSYVPSPNLSTIIAEIQARGGWAANNAIVLIAAGDNTTPPESAARFTPYETDPTSTCTLYIEYTPAASAQTIAVNTVTLAGSVPNSVVLSGSSIALSTISLESSVAGLTIGVGGGAVVLSTLSLASNLPVFTPHPGTSIDSEFNSLSRSPYSQVTIERWLPEWTAQISGLSAGGLEEFAHGHSVSVAVDGNGAGEDIIFRARSGAYATPQDGKLYFAVIYSTDLDDPTAWDTLWTDSGITGLMYPAWTANSNQEHGGSIATAIWDDGGTLKGRIFYIEHTVNAGDLKYVDITLSTEAVSAATTIATFTNDIQRASMQIAACKYDEVFILLNSLVEAGLTAWQGDVYGSFIRRYYYSASWLVDNSFPYLTHAEGGLLRDTGDEKAEFGDASADLLAANWEKRYCGGLAVNDIDDNMVVISYGQTYWNRWGFSTHSQGVKSFIYYRDSGWWGPGPETDQADFIDGARFAFSTFARGFEIEAANFIVWSRSTEPSNIEQAYDNITIPRNEEVVFAKFSASGKLLTQYVHLGDQTNLTAASIVALNHGGSKLLYAIGWRSVYESPPAAILCSVPDADKQDLASYATGWNVNRNDRQGMSITVNIADPSLLNSPTIVKAGALAKLYFGTVGAQIQVGQGFMETDSPQLSIGSDGSFSEGATINFRADDLLLNTRAEYIEDVVPQKVIDIPPPDPLRNVEIEQGTWNLATLTWPTVFFSGQYDALQDEPCLRLQSFYPNHSHPTQPNGYISWDGLEGSVFRDIAWINAEAITDGAIEASVRYGAVLDQSDWQVTVLCNPPTTSVTRVYDVDVTKNANGIFTRFDIYQTDTFCPSGPTFPQQLWISCVNWGSMAGLVVFGADLSHKYAFVWEESSVTTGTGITLDSPKYSRSGSNNLFLVVTDSDGNEIILQSLQGIAATGLTPGKPADLKVQVINGNIHCYYRAHSTTSANAWRWAFSHNAGNFVAGRYGLIGRGGGMNQESLPVGAGIPIFVSSLGKEKYQKLQSQVDFWNIKVSNAIEDQCMEDTLRRYAWRGYTETTFRPYVDNDSRTVNAGTRHHYYDLLENPVIDFNVSIPANGNEAGVYVRGVLAAAPTRDCIRLGLVPHSTANSSGSTVNYYLIKRRYANGSEVTTARETSPLPIQLLPGVSVPVRVTVRGPTYRVWIAGNYAGHFVDNTSLGLHYGLYAEGGNATFSNIYVPELYEVPAFALLEVNQAMNDALKKVIGRRRVKGHWTPDGKLKFSYFLTRDPAPALHEDYYWASSIRRNPRYLSKVRVQGTNTFAIYQSDVLAKKGQRYEIIQNPEVNYREFAYREAQKIVTEIAEQQLEVTLTGLPDPRIDPEDEATATLTRQALNGSVTIIEVTIDFTFGDNPQATGVIVARQQVAL